MSARAYLRQFLCQKRLDDRPRRRGNALKALLKMLLGTGALAGSVSLVLVVQSVATYTSLIPFTRTSAAPAAAATTTRTPVVTGVSVDTQHGWATLTMSPFTTENAASALGATYGMNLLADFPAFGRYIFSLPQIRIGPGPEQHTATIYFPPYATQADITAFFTHNGLQVNAWVSTDDTTGRTAVVALPQIKPTLVDQQRGIWQAWVALNLDRGRLDGWASANGVQIISYDPNTGQVLIQGPKPQPVYTRVVRTVPPVVKTTTPAVPQTSKLYVAFKPGTTFTQAQDAIQQAGGQVTSFDSNTELAVATVPVGKESQATTALTASAQVSCVGASSTSCPAATPAPAPTTSSTTTQTTCDPTTTSCPAPPPPADTTATGTGWTTTVTAAPSTTTTTVPLQLQATPSDGHVSLSWSAVTAGTDRYYHRDEPHRRRRHPRLDLRIQHRPCSRRGSRHNANADCERHMGRCDIDSRGAADPAGLEHIERIRCAECRRPNGRRCRHRDLVDDQPGRDDHSTWHGERRAAGLGPTDLVRPRSLGFAGGR
jgi:hypothetical protein